MPTPRTVAIGRAPRINNSPSEEPYMARIPPKSSATTAMATMTQAIRKRGGFTATPGRANRRCFGFRLVGRVRPTPCSVLHRGGRYFASLARRLSALLLERPLRPDADPPGPTSVILGPIL